MKQIQYILLSACTLLILFQSCSLNRDPLTDIPEDKFWKDEKSAQLALTAIYRGGIVANDTESDVADFWSYAGMLFMEHLSDNAFDRDGENNAQFEISSGKLISDNVVIKDYWASAYKRINRCNRFLEGIPKLADSPTKTRMIAEVRFLRATQYHYLASYFKDVPLVTRLLSAEEANNVKRTPQADILAWCATEFREAAKDLPRFKDLPAQDGGRACKQAALAFLGRTCMLMKDWKAGAAAYKEIIDYGDNDIHPKYSELFLPGTGVSNKENIFYISYLENYFGCGLPQHILPAKNGGWSRSNPAAGLFEAYEFKDGTPFSYQDARYNPDNLGENRDPRLDYTIFYNGAQFMGSEYRMSPDYDAGKKERLDYSSEASKTGFMWRKYFGEAPISNLTSYSAVTPVIRYAEVLLSYLECLIESGQGVSQPILDNTINKIRGRQDVEMPPIKETDPAKLRQIVRDERRVELAFEGIRYWDLLRWGIADKVLVGPIWGAPYPKSKTYATSTKEVDPTGNCRWYVGRRDFRNPQDYKWPIPLSEQNINPNLRD